LTTNLAHADAGFVIGCESGGFSSDKDNEVGNVGFTVDASKYGQLEFSGKA
jgi:hypothetical protein